MTKQEFLDKINESKEQFEILEKNEKCFFVLNKKTDKKYEIRKDILESTDYENLISVLSGRDAVVVDGITRIVGYFSKISNWNKSKIGELDDRRKGNYKIGDC